MAAEAVTGQYTGRGEGATTNAAKKGAGVGSAAGIGVGAAVAQVLVWVLGQFGLDAQELELPLGTVLSAIYGAVIAWYGAKWAGSMTPTDRVQKVLVGDTSEQELARDRAAAEAASVAPVGASTVTPGEATVEPFTAAPSTASTAAPAPASGSTSASASEETIVVPTVVEVD